MLKSKTTQIYVCKQIARERLSNRTENVMQKRELLRDRCFLHLVLSFSRTSHSKEKEDHHRAKLLCKLKSSIFCTDGMMEERNQEHGNITFCSSYTIV